MEAAVNFIFQFRIINEPKCDHVPKPENMIVFIFKFRLKHIHTIFLRGILLFKHFLPDQQQMGTACTAQPLLLLLEMKALHCCCVQQ